MEWQTIDSAPKSTAVKTPHGWSVNAEYLLGFCPDESLNPKACLTVIWWEPKTPGANGKEGCWYGDGAMEVVPTHWQPLPTPPKQPDDGE